MSGRVGNGALHMLRVRWYGNPYDRNKCMCGRNGDEVAHGAGVQHKQTSEREDSVWRWGASMLIGATRGGAPPPLFPYV